MAEITPSPISAAALTTDLKHVRTVNADTTIISTDYSIEVDASGGNRIITLPTAISQFSAILSAGRVFNIKKIDSTANAVTITPQAGETIDGLSSIAISAKDVNYTIQSDGTTNWLRL